MLCNVMIMFTVMITCPPTADPADEMIQAYRASYDSSTWVLAFPVAIRKVIITSALSHQPTSRRITVIK